MIKLFVVDDDEIICDGIANMDWDCVGARVVGRAYDGELALREVKSALPDIMIVDICMPFLDGLQLTEALKRDHPQIKVIMLTAFREFEYAQKAIELQVVRYLTKPFDNLELLEAVRDTIERIEKDSAPPEKENKQPSGSENPYVRQAIEYIELHYVDPKLGLSQVADVIHITPTYLSALFKQCRQTNFNSYLSEVRVCAAMKLLLDPGNKAYEIAERVGYTSGQYFSVCFKKLTGFTPGEYRNRQRVL